MQELVFKSQHTLQFSDKNDLEKWLTQEFCLKSDIFNIVPKSGRKCQKIARMTKDSQKYQIFLLTCGYFHFGPVVGFKMAGRLDLLPIPRGQSVIKQH